MTTLDKINQFLDQLDKKYDLYEDRLIEASKEGGKEYDKFFNSMLKKYKVKSYKDLPKNKQSKFFDEVDKAWSAKKETD